MVNLEGTGAVFNVGPMLGLCQEGAAGLRALGRVLMIAIDTTALSRALEGHPKLAYPSVRSICPLALAQCQGRLGSCLDLQPA